MSKKIVVKLGTNALTNADGSLNLPLLKDLVRQLAILIKEHHVLFVTSGAMGAGRTIINKEMQYDETTNRQLYAVVGQVKLMEIYSNMFKDHGVIVAQMLATRQDFENRTHCLNTKNCIESLFREGIIPIMNENDFVCVEELMFTDNDELSGIVSGVLFADTLIILSNVDGVLDAEGKVIREFHFNDELPENIISKDKSSFGKGGMQTKFKVAQNVAKRGTEVYIANSKESDVILRIINGESVGTRFIPDKK
ncbi:glutamate 5-kinase [Candidatus Peregrinibacteria bacterium]|nr:glutamate 5-kinase [Candidatus Peregrinibacteria bacterium]